MTEDLARVALEWRAHLVRPPTNLRVIRHAPAGPHGLPGHYHSKLGPRIGVVHAHQPHTPSVSMPSHPLGQEAKGGGSLLPRLFPT